MSHFEDVEERNYSEESWLDEGVEVHAPSDFVQAQRRDREELLDLYREEQRRRKRENAPTFRQRSWKEPK